MRISQLVDVLEQCDGVARSRALLSAGATKRELAAAVRADAIERLREGVYAVPTTDADVISAARHGGELACVSALRSHGVWVLTTPARPHVWLGAKGRRHRHPECACVDHHDAGRSGFGVVSVRLALIQAAACSDDETFFAAYESAWRQGMLTSADRASIRRSIPASSRWLVDLARPNADSGLESLLRLRLHMLGIALASQVLISGVGRVDLVAEGFLIIEVDGRQNHDGPSLRHKDLVRDAAAASLGYDTLRFDYALIVHDWHIVERAILARLRDRGVPVAGR